MGLSLFGIIALQWYWLNMAFEIKSQEFDRAIFESLNAVVNKLEHDEASDYIKKTLISKNEITDTLKSQYITINKLYAQNNKDKQLEENDTSIYYDESSYKVHTIYRKSNSYINIREKTADSVLMAIKLQSKGVVIRNAIQKIIVDNVTKNQPIEYRLYYDQVKQLLKTALEQKNINIKHEFAIQSNNFLSCTYPIYSDGFKLNQENNSYRIALFPNDIVSKLDYLWVQFPNRDSHLLRTVWWLYGLSIFFTLIIIGAFLSTLNIIYQQKKISQIKTDFINNMTHEFKTPIATISLAADALHNHKVLDSKNNILYYSDIIKKENKRMNLQVETILQMSLLEKKDFKLDQQNINIQDVIQKSVERMRLQFENKQAQVQLALNSTNAQVFADETHLSNVLINLLDNALKYSNDFPKITISSKLIENDIIIKVKDNGIGMSKEIQKNVFEKFFRGAMGNLHNTKGFGLGLSYAKVIINAHNGSISVKSEPNKGSEFFIMLPIIKQ